MIHIVLVSLIAAGMAMAGMAGPAVAAEAGPRYENSFGCIPSACPAGAEGKGGKVKARGRQPQKYLEMKLKKTLVVPVRPQAAKPKQHLKAKKNTACNKQAGATIGLAQAESGGSARACR